MNQPTPLPTRKVGAGAVGGAVGVILVWVIALFGVDVPAEVAASISTLLGFLAGYLIPERG